MANDDFPMSQDEIERLFRQTKGPAGAGHHVPMVGGNPLVGAGPAKASPAAPARNGGKNAPSLAQNEIEKLLNNLPSPFGRGAGGEGGSQSVAAAPTMAKSPAVAPSAQEPDIAPPDIEHLLAQAEKALESVNSDRLDEIPAGVSSYQLDEFSPATPALETATLDLIRDVELELKIELGRTHMYLEDVLQLRKGSVVPLDKLAGDPVDIYVNGRLVARGEVLVLNDNFCVRVAELIVGANVFS